MVPVENGPIPKPSMLGIMWNLSFSALYSKIFNLRPSPKVLIYMSSPLEVSSIRHRTQTKNTHKHGTY